MQGRPLVSVIIPHYQDLERLDLCLADLQRQTLPADQFEVIVSDNGSPAGEAAVAAVIAGRAKLVVTLEKGAGPARNGGVAVARGEILAFTDSDCRPEPDWLREGVAALNDYDFVGGPMKVIVERTHGVTPVEAFECVFAFDIADYIARKGFTATGNLFCPCSLFDKVGNFRTGVSEDIEWCHRARAMGFRLGYAPAAIVRHPARRSWEELVAKWRRMNREQFGLMRHRRYGRLHWTVRNCAIPLSAIVHTPKVLKSHELSGWNERLKALGVLYRIRGWRFVDGLRLLTTPPG